MKNYLPAIVFSGFIITIILQGVLFASTSLQSQHLKTQIAEISKKIDALQLASDNSLDSISKLKSEIQTSEDKLLENSQALALAESDPNNLLSATNLSKTLGTTTISPTKTNLPTSETKNQKIRLKSNWNNVDVYETAKPSSRIIGQIGNGKDYPIITKQQDWYQIKIDTLTNAWVQSQFVYETN